MSDGDLSPGPSETDKPRVTTLGYEAIPPDQIPGPRPWWVYAMVGMYLLVLAAFMGLPIWENVVFGLSFSDDKVLIVFTGGMLACGMALMIVPVRVIRRRPVTRRSILIPVIVSSLLAAALCCGAVLALDELLKIDKQVEPYLILVPVCVWLGWLIVFLLMGRRNPGGIGAALHRWLMAGSVLELLIAVPSHVIVRRRGECCAGIGTGIGICTGVAVMIVAFGPSVLLLYHRRRKQISYKRGSC